MTAFMRSGRRRRPRNRINPVTTNPLQTLLGDVADVQFAQLAGVDRTCREIREDSGVVDQKKVAILAAIAVTDQLFRMRDGVEVVKGLAEKRAERLTGEILASLEKTSSD